MNDLQALLEIPMIAMNFKTNAILLLSSPVLICCVLFAMNNILPMLVNKTNKGNDGTMLSFRKKEVRW